MKENFTHLIPDPSKLRSQTLLKTTLLFFLLFVYNAVSAQAPSINISNGLSRNCATVGKSFELTINGSGFVAGAVVRVTGTSFQGETILTPKSITATQLKVDLSGNGTLLANTGTLTIDVRQEQNAIPIFSNAVQMSVYPVTTAISGATSACVGAAANYSVPALAYPASYAWSVTSGIAAISAGGTTATAEVSFGSTPGPVTLQVVITPDCNGASAITASFNVTVNNLPAVTLAPFNNICTNAGVLTLTGGSPGGGIYTVDGVLATITDENGVITSSFDPSTAAPGEHEIIYYFTQNGCTGSATQKITVVEAPSASLAPIANVCANAPVFNFTGGQPTAGTYEVDGLPATSFNPATATIGSHTITYTVTQGGCTSTATQTFSVLPATTVSLEPFNDVCSNATAFVLTGGLPAGGTYTGPGVSNGQFNPAVAGAGIHTITYAVTQNGCTSTESQTITVLAAPTVTLAPLANVCSDAGIITLNGALPAGGTFTGPGVSNGQFNPAVAGVGTHTITYTVTQGNCTSSATQTLTVVQPPSATIQTPIGTQSCQGGTIPLTVDNTFGASYQWLLNGNEILGANTQNLNAKQSGTYSVRVTNNGCSVTSTTVEITILDPATIIIEGPSVQLCTPQTAVLHAVTGYTGYQWYKDNAILTGQTSPTLTVSATGDYYVVVNTTIGTCLSVKSAVTRVEVGSAIANNTINATSPVCAGSTVNITGQPATGGSGTPSYQWQISTNGGSYTNITTDGNSQDYSYTATNVTQITTVSFRRVVTAGACTSISNLVSVTINPAIVVNPINTNNRTICSGNDYTIVAPQPLRTSGDGDFTFQWQRSSTGAANSFVDLPNTNTKDYLFQPGSFSGITYFRRIITSGGCTNISGVVPVTVNPAIANNTITTLDRDICEGSSLTIQATIPTGGNGSYKYRWQSSSTGAANTFRNITTPSGDNRNFNTLDSTFTGTVYFQRVVTSGPAATACTSISNPVKITFTPPIAGNDNILTPDRSLCTGTSLIIEAPEATGGSGTITYQWQRSDDNVNFVNVTNRSQNNQNYLFSPGNFTGDAYFRRIVYSDACNNISSKSVRITVQQTSTYTLILTANPFPVCGQAVYTARVYKDVTSVSYPADPQYGQVTQVGGTDVTNLFTFDWWKNDTDPIPSNNTSHLTIASPQSRDYYTVRARPNNVAPTCFLYNNRPDFVPTDRGANVLFSNRIYRGAPFGYAVNITTNAQTSNTVCAGTAVTFTATPSSANFVNPKYQWQVNGQNIQGQTASAFTSSSLSSGDIVTVTFTSDENRCDPITSNPITIQVASPQVLTGGGSYCVSDPVGGVTIQMDDSQVGILYQLMLGNTKVFLPVPGNGGPISFGYHKYTSGTYSVQAIIPSANGNAAVNCSVFGSVEVNYTPALTHTVTITPPTELVVGQPATFTANSSIASYNPTYKWYVFDFTNPNAGFVLQPGANTNTFVLQSVPEGDIEIRVDVQAPTSICVDDADGLMSDVTGQIGPLPVELIYLKATKQDNNVVEVEWATAMEQNSEGFEVQVSQDAKNYRTLAFVASKAGGNTNQKQVYTFHDKENGKYGTRYYRLMQRDMNGDAEYFGPKAVQIGETTESLSVYPNPFVNEINLELNAEEAGTMHVIVTNAIGAKVLERTFNVQKGSNKQSLRFKDGLPLGMYNITTRLNGKTRHLKLMKR